MQGDGPHQPLVNELQLAHHITDSKEVFQVSGTPKPRLPISKRKDLHVLGQEFILLDECPDPTWVAGIHKRKA